MFRPVRGHFQVLENDASVENDLGEVQTSFAFIVNFHYKKSFNILIKETTQ